MLHLSGFVFCFPNKIRYYKLWNGSNDPSYLSPFIRDSNIKKQKLVRNAYVSTRLYTSLITTRTKKTLQKVIGSISMNVVGTFCATCTATSSFCCYLYLAEILSAPRELHGKPKTNILDSFGT